MIIPEVYEYQYQKDKLTQFEAIDGEFAEGLAAAVKAAGEKLKVFFPISSDDINEQPDEISFGK